MKAITCVSCSPSPLARPTGAGPRPRTRACRLLGAWLGACALALTGTAQSTSPFRLDLREVAKRADVAFVAQVVSQRQEALPDLGMAFTHVTFRVERMVFDRTGSAPGDLITLVFAGGTVGNETVTVAGVPEFRTGEEVVLLTYYDENRYASPVVGRNAGLFRVTYDERTYARYPLTADGAGIESIEKGSLVLAERVETVRSGRPVYVQQAAPLLASAPPPPVPASGAADVPWPTLSRLPDSRPDHLVELDAFLDSIFAMYRELPAGRQ